MNDEIPQFFDTPELEKAYQQRERDDFERNLFRVPFDVPFCVDNMVLIMEHPRDEELSLYESSKTRGIEIGLVRVGNRIRLIDGEAHKINSALIIEAIEELGSQETPKSFSHTHTGGSSANPLPSQLDRKHFWRLQSRFSDCECRVVSGIQDKVITFIFRGDKRDMVRKGKV